MRGSQSRKRQICSFCGQSDGDVTAISDSGAVRLCSECFETYNEGGIGLEKDGGKESIAILPFRNNENFMEALYRIIEKLQDHQTPRSEIDYFIELVGVRLAITPQEVKLPFEIYYCDSCRERLVARSGGAVCQKCGIMLYNKVEEGIE